MKKHNRLLKVVLTIVFFGVSLSSTAQKRNEFFLLSDSEKIIFKKPYNYCEVAKNMYLKRTNDSHEHPGLLLKVLENSNLNIAIGIVAWPIYYSPYKNLQDSLRSNYSYLGRVVSQQDESSFKTIALGRRLRKKHNADAGKIYQLKLEKLFLDKYDKCRVLILHKENVSDAEIYFFYTADSQLNITEEIQKNMAMIKFK